MTTAEKRAALEAEGEPWPDCECHGEPLLWMRNTRLAADGRWRCRVQMREWRKRHRIKRIASGLCLDCPTPIPSGIRCQPCKDQQADHMAQPYQRLRHQLADARYRTAQNDASGVLVDLFYG